MNQNPFPEKQTIAHEVGHMLAVWDTASKYGASISFFAWDEGEAARANYKTDGITPAQRVAIAVAGATAQHEAGVTGYLDAQTDPVALFLPPSGPVAYEIQGDFQTTIIYAGQIRPPVTHAAAVRHAVTRARAIIRKLGGGLMVAAVSERIRLWLEDDDRQRWRKAIAGDGAPVFEEVTFHRELEEIGRAQPKLLPGAKALQLQIERSRKARGVPPINPRAKSAAS